MKKILFIYTDKFLICDIAWAFIELGYQMEFYEDHLYTYSFDDRAVETEKLSVHLKNGSYWFVLSYNFVNSISRACESLNIPYVGWTFDSLTLSLFDHQVKSPFNFTYVFDHDEYSLVKKLFNPPHLFYMPLAANISRFGGTIISDEDIRKFSSDISFVGNLYDSDELETLEKTSSIPQEILDHFYYLIDYYVGRWGNDTIYNCLTDDECSIINHYMPVGANNQYSIPDSYFYPFLYLGRRIANKDRILLLTTLGNRFKTDLYGPIKDIDLPVNQKGSISYFEDFPKVAYLSKINIHITIPRISSGISQRCFDVMGSGGFLMANYRADMLRHFEPDNDFVMYENTDELISKCEYYLSHDKARKEIAMNGYKKVVDHHSTIHRATKMINDLHDAGFYE